MYLKTFSSNKSIRSTYYNGDEFIWNLEHVWVSYFQLVFFNDLRK